MNTELTTARANLIYDLHNESQESAKQGKECIQKAIDAAIRCGEELAQIKNGQRLAWLRDNVPSITPELCRAYIGIANTQSKRKCVNACHRQLLMLGIIDGKEESNDDWRKEKDNLKQPWLAWAGKLCGFVNTATKQRPLSEWTETEKRVVSLQLKPIAEFYKKITEE